MDQLGSASQWGQYGGILGLVIFALFFMLASFMSLVLWRFIKTEDKRQEFFEKVVAHHERERQEWIVIAKESVKALSENSSAIVSFKHQLSDVSNQLIGVLTKKT